MIIKANKCQKLYSLNKSTRHLQLSGLLLQFIWAAKRLNESNLNLIGNKLDQNCVDSDSIHLLNDLKSQDSESIRLLNEYFQFI